MSPTGPRPFSKREQEALTGIYDQNRTEKNPPCTDRALSLSIEHCGLIKGGHQVEQRCRMTQEVAHVVFLFDFLHCWWLACVFHFFFFLLEARST